MIAVTLDTPDDFDGWRDAVRRLILAQVAPTDVSWSVAGRDGDLFAPTGDPLPEPKAGTMLTVPRDVIALTRSVILHRDPERFALLHSLLARLHGKTLSLADRTDPLLVRIEKLAKEVRRDIHKMRAFVRFRMIEGSDEIEPRYVAWFEPDNHIVRTNARFFIDRFASMHWSILTPEISVHWDGKALSEGPGAVRGDAPDGDPVEDAWKRYYASIFNPSRLKIGAMMKEMPRKYWANMPETALVPGLIAGAQARSAAMIAAGAAPATAADAVHPEWAQIVEAAKGCTRCPLYGPATQMVFGEGPRDAALMLVGEQPGDQEDLAGRPFVGPAGQLLDAALAEAGIDRSQLYVTNAVKHFKYEQRGKRRIHQAPTAGEVVACRWWLDKERALVRPRLVVALGATAARSLFGRAMPVGKSRGQALVLPDGTAARITVHPSYLLRLPDPVQAARERVAFIADLVAARDQLTAPI
jgi:uracil-DNA glycosylase